MVAETTPQTTAPTPDSAIYITNALAASLYGAAAVGFCYFLGGSLGSGIAPMHGILESSLMAAHVVVIILGHALAVNYLLPGIHSYA
jgi:hypothetical protein